MSNDDILIFRTATKRRDIEQIRTLFAQYPQIHEWSVDLEDWEKVLRIESRGITAARVIELLHTIGIVVSELE